MTGKRLIPVACLLAGLCVALGGSAAAGGGGWGSPGKYSYNDSSAMTFLSNGTDGAWVMVDHGLLTFKDRRVPGAPVIQQFGTALQVSLQSFESGSSAWGCWIIPDSAFSVANNLSTAHLNINTSAATPCPAPYIGATAGARPGLQGPVADGGGGGGGGWGDNGGLSASLDITWTSNGGVWHSQNTQSSHCGSYTTSGQGSDTNTFATASGSVSYSTAAGTVSSLTGMVDPYANIVQSSFSGNASGTLSTACGGWGP